MTANGYTGSAGGGGGSVAWVDISGKPSTFPPSAHTHPSTDLSDSTTVGRALVTAASAAAARTTLGTDAVYQPLDSDLTTLAGLTATSGNTIQAVGGAWASQTPSQVRTTLTLLPSILLGPTDPIPGGTPANTLIIRTT